MTNRLNLAAEFGANEPADPETVTAAMTALGVQLPADYGEFLLGCDGGEGFVGENYLVLWRAKELAQFNVEYEVASYAPGLVLFGGDGAGELFAFDTRSSPMPVVVVPGVGMELDSAHRVAGSFGEFLRALASSQLEDL